MTKKNFTFSLDVEIMQQLKLIAIAEKRTLSAQFILFIENGIKKEMQPKKQNQKEWFTINELHSQLNINISKSRFLKVLLNSNVENKTINGIYYFKKN